MVIRTSQFGGSIESHTFCQARPAGHVSVSTLRDRLFSDLATKAENTKPRNHEKQTPISRFVLSCS